MYKARFFWSQDVNYPIYKDLLKPIMRSSQSMSGSLSQQGVGSMAPISLDLDINEDFTYEIKSNFQNYGDVLSGLPFVGSMMGYMDTMNTLSSLGGKSNTSSEWMKFQVWKETEPFKMNFKFVLSNYSDPFIDVYAPAMALCSMTMLSPVTTEDDKKNKSTSFYAPGINSYSMAGLNRDKDTKKETKQADPSSGSSLNIEDKKKAGQDLQNRFKESSKIIKEFIIWGAAIDGGTTFSAARSESKVPGIPLLIVKNCFIESAKPTWSKDRTASGIPIWCELELGIQSIFSANDSMFSYLTQTPNYTGGLDATKKIATNIFR